MNLFRHYPLLIILTITICLFFLIFNYVPQKYGMWADQATHLMQSMSIAFDRDLKYTAEDLERFYKSGWDQGPEGLFLKQHGNSFYYAKPLLYSFFSAPFTAILGAQGQIFLNGLLFILIFILTYFWLKPHTKKTVLAIGVSLLLILISPAFLYIFIIHPDITSAFLLFTSMFFWCYYETLPPDKKIGFNLADFKPVLKLKHICLILSSFFCGLAIYERLPFVVFAFFIPTSLIIRKKFLSSIAFLVIVFIAWSIPTSINLLQDGNFSAYKGERYYYLNDFPYLKGKEVTDVAAKPMSFDSAINLSNLISNGDTLLKNTRYYLADFLVGRQTGILIYFPAILLCIAGLINSKLYELYYKLPILFAAFGYVILIFLLMPQNYFGGSSSFGNRYFLQVYPALFFLISKLNKRLLKILIPIILIGSVFLMPHIIHPYEKIKKHIDIITQYPFTVLPMDITQIESIYNDAPGLIYRFENGHNLYRINKLSYGNGEKGFWTVGKAKADFILQSKKSYDVVEITLGSGPVQNEVIIKSKIMEKKIFLNKNGPMTMDINVRPEKVVGKETNLYYFFLSIETKNGFIPKEVLKTSDTRYLGVYIMDIKGLN